MRSLFFSLILFLAALNTYASGADVEKYTAATEEIFDFDQDTLCFINTNFNSGHPLLQLIANAGGGACQGMVALTKALKENVEFVCDRTNPEASGVTAVKIEQAVDLMQRFSTNKVQIRGYCSIKQLCNDFRPEFQSLALNLNYDMVFKDVLPFYSNQSMTLIDFVNQSDNSLALRSDVNVQKSNAKELGKIFHSLARGKYPLLLYPHHVVMVIQMEYKRAYDGNITVRLVFYDPDDNRRSKNKVFSVKADWSETINAMPIFML